MPIAFIHTWNISQMEPINGAHLVDEFDDNWNEFNSVCSIHLLMMTWMFSISFKMKYQYEIFFHEIMSNYFEEKLLIEQKMSDSHSKEIGLVIREFINSSQIWFEILRIEFDVAQH